MQQASLRAAIGIVPQDMVLVEQHERQITVEDAEPWFARVRSALTDPDSFGEVFMPIDEYMSGEKTGEFVVRAAGFSQLLSILIGLDTARQSGVDVVRMRRVLETIGFKKVRPNKGWMGSSYAYDLTRKAAEHLWPAIVAAKNAQRFPKWKSESQSF